MPTRSVPVFDVLLEAGHTGSPSLSDFPPGAIYESHGRKIGGDGGRRDGPPAARRHPDDPGASRAGSALSATRPVAGRPPNSSGRPGGRNGRATEGSSGLAPAFVGYIAKKIDDAHRQHKREGWGRAEDTAQQTAKSVLAQKILKLATSGERDRGRLHEAAIKAP